MNIGYAKIGRSMPLTLDKCGFVGGDNECITVVDELAQRRPQDTFYLVGRNSGEEPTRSNIKNPWRDWQPEYAKFQKSQRGLDTTEGQLATMDWHDGITVPFIKGLDALVLWIGQHGSTNMPIPSIEDRAVLTKPQQAFIHYASFIFRGINAWRDEDPINREEIYINADPRNRLKLRDLKWPLQHPVQCQFNSTNALKHERFGDERKPDEHWRRFASNGEPGLWTSNVRNIYTRLEINGVLPNTPVGDLLTYDETWHERQSFGLFINEARAYVKEELTRLFIMQKYVMPLEPAFIHGVWSDESLAKLGVDIQPRPFKDFSEKLHSVRSTFTTPTSGSGWATTKPWEAFACGTVCFFHHGYDTQGHILKDAPEELRSYLKIFSAMQLKERVREMNEDEDKWRHIIQLQRAHYDKAGRERTYVHAIEARLDARPVGGDTGA